MRFNQLTPAEAERLDILVEEAGEIVQAIGKINRHGYDSYNPLIPGSVDNRLQLWDEINQLIAVAEAMAEQGDIPMLLSAYDRHRLWLKKLRWSHDQVGAQLPCSPK